MIVVIVGPTGVGKTKLSVELAILFHWVCVAFDCASCKEIVLSLMLIEPYF